MKNKRIHIVAATTLSAILLWGSIIMSDEYLTSVSVPLVIENLPAGKGIATPLPRALQVKLRGNGWRHAAFLLGPEAVCLIDLHSFQPTRSGLTLTDIVERMTLPTGIHAVDMKPESVFIAFDKYAQRSIPVVLHADVAFRAGYGQVGPVVISPESITLGGAASLLSTVSSWPTAHSTFADLTSTLNTELPLSDSASQYINFFPKTVRVRMDVQQFAEKTFRGLPVATLDVPFNREVILIPPKIDIVVRGGIEQLASLGNESFRASVEYDVVVIDSSGYTEARIAVPKGVHLVSKRPERMQFIIRTRL